MDLTRVGAVAFHCAGRMRVLARDVLRFGTAIFLSLFFWGVLVSIPCVFGGQLVEPHKCCPSWIDGCLVLMARVVKKPCPTLRAQAEAIFLTDGLKRQ